MSLGTPAVISRALLDFVSRIAFVTASGYGSPIEQLWLVCRRIDWQAAAYRHGGRMIANDSTLKLARWAIGRCMLPLSTCGTMYFVRR
jgi:hypothetical protein